MNYLDKRCEYSECNNFLPASKDKRDDARKKKDAARRFCSEACMHAHKKQRVGSKANPFLYGGREA